MMPIIRKLPLGRIVIAIVCTILTAIFISAGTANLAIGLQRSGFLDPMRGPGRRPPMRVKPAALYGCGPQKFTKYQQIGPDVQDLIGLAAASRRFRLGV